MSKLAGLAQGEYFLEPGPPPASAAESMVKLILAAARAMPSLDQVRATHAHVFIDDLDTED